EIMAVAGAAGLAGKIRARARRAAEREKMENHLRRKSRAERLRTHPGAIRRRGQPHDCGRPRAAGHQRPRAESPPGSSHAKPLEFLARELSENQTGASAQVSQTRVALMRGWHASEAQSDNSPAL